MKLSIQVEIAPDEVALASELLATLRTITEHIGDAEPPFVTNIPELVQAMVDRLADPATHEAAAADLCAALANPTLGEPSTIADSILSSLEGIIFNVDLVLKGQSVAPYLELLRKLPETHKNKVSKGIMQKVLSHLAKKRKVDVIRTEFFGQAEAFAVLVKLDFIAIDGAAQTIEKLLGKTDTRSAAVTMLGKTVELCHEKLISKCNPTHLANLKKALDKVTEECFSYDITWVNESMGWSQALSTDAASTTAAAALPTPTPVPQASTHQAATPTQPRGLHIVQTLSGHASSVITMCCDASQGNMYSCGKDTTVNVWGASGQKLHNMMMSREVGMDQFVYGMDVHPANNMLLLCGMTNDSGCRIAVYDANNRWTPKGVLSRQDRSLISCIRHTGADNNGFVTAETVTRPTGTKELVCYYDLGSSSSIATMQPVRTYAEHDQMVLCVAPCPSNSNLFATGSRESTIRLWDKRVDRSVASILEAHPAPDPTSELQKLTCIDIVDNMMLSAGTDGIMCFWDVRSMSSTPSNPHMPLCRMRLDGDVILKVAVANAPVPNVAAVSTFQGLYVVDYTNLSAPLILAATAPSTPARPQKPYHDLKWGVASGGGRRLYAANEYPTIDVFQMF